MQSELERDVCSKLVGQDCQWCTDGELEQTTYKDKKAVVCMQCETPAAQFW
jgi:hypothetical protein